MLRETNGLLPIEITNHPHKPERWKSNDYYNLSNDSLNRGYNGNTCMTARVYVSMKPSVLDAQGQAIHSALKSLGHTMVQDVRQGKFFDLQLAATDKAAAAAEIEKISHDILSNPVIEDYKVELMD